MTKAGGRVDKPMPFCLSNRRWTRGMQQTIACLTTRWLVHCVLPKGRTQIL